MKRLFLIIFAILMLTACGKKADPAPESPQDPEVQEEVTVPAEPADEPEEETEEELPAEEGEPVAYTCQLLEGLVEDTVGYTFEIPAFEIPGAETVQQYYQALAEHLEGYTKEEVYAEAAERACVVSVFGRVTEAVSDGETLTVTYVFECDFSDSETPEETARTDSFDVTTGDIIE